MPSVVRFVGAHQFAVLDEGMDAFRFAGNHLRSLIGITGFSPLDCDMKSTRSYNSFEVIKSPDKN